MSETLQRVIALINQNSVRISAHGYDELVEDDILTRDVISGISTAIVVEDYPDYHKGPAVLTLQYDLEGSPIHVLWGIPKSKLAPAVLVTAYRPDPARWSSDFTKRQK